MRLLVIRHEESCPPGLLADAAAKAGLELEVVDGAVRNAPRARRVLDAFCRVVARGTAA